MAKLTLTDISAGYLSIGTYNANNTLIETALENTLSRDGTIPNTMEANLDINSNRVVNLADAVNNQDAVSLAQLTAASVTIGTTTATLTTIVDAAGNYDATTVEGALAEVYTDFAAADTADKAELAAITNGDGASLVGVEDVAGYYAGATVEDVLANIGVSIAALEATTVYKYKTADQSVTSSTTLVNDTHLASFAVAANGVYAIEGYLEYTQNVGDIKMQLTYSASPSKRSYSIFAVDEAGVTDEDTDNAGVPMLLIGITDASDAAITFRGYLTFGGSAGTATLQWAQNTSDANATTLREGSWLKFTKIG